MAINLVKTKKLTNSIAESEDFWESICKRIVAVLSKKYRLHLDFEQAKLEICTYEQLTERHAGDGHYLASVFRAEGIRSPVFLIVDATSGTSLCNVLLGGNASFRVGSVKTTDLQVAPISRQLETRFLQVFAAFMAEELSKFGLGNLRYGSSETDLRLFSQIPADTECLEIKVSFRSGEQTITVAMFLPFAAVKRLELQKNRKDDSPYVQTLSYKHLQDLEVDVAVALATLNMTLKDLVTLVPGEILNLDLTGSLDAQLMVEGKYFKSGQLKNSADSKWAFVVAESN
jgi:flagellar motor switch protein FliM